MSDFCDPVDYTLHGTLQARTLEWVACTFSRGSSQPRSPTLQADSLPAEPPGKPCFPKDDRNFVKFYMLLIEIIGEGNGAPLQYSWASFMAQLVKNPPAVWETWVGKIPWRKERLYPPVSWPKEFHRLYSPWGHKESDTTE